MSKSALDFLIQSVISKFSFRKPAHYRQIHTVHYADIYTVLCFVQERKKKKKTSQKNLQGTAAYIMQNRSTVQEQKLKQVSIHTLYYYTATVKEQKV